ncbi:MAG: metallophosphoesterase, partial [Candidatus Omnitrophica bacterium]|nr:metallophosphoesterase [Candidatus Omnitrophota bacterium]
YNTDIWNTNVELQAGENKITVTAIDKYYNSVTKEITVYYNPEFNFVHMTDIHIGSPLPRWLWIIDVFGIEDYQPYPGFLDQWEKSLDTLTATYEAAVRDVKEVTNSKPSFFLFTGDLVEREDESFFQDVEKIIDVMNKNGDTVYSVPGNHDRRNRLFETTNLARYNAIIKPKNGPSTQLNDGFGDYYFDFGGYQFIGLDSGHDFSVIDSTPEGSGLEDIQYNSLQKSDIKDHPNKIVFMHHPVINEGIDIFGTPLALNLCPKYGENDACIAQNRCGFINYCTDYNVQLVLTGHTHESKVFNGNGQEVSENYASRPLFIQTPNVQLGYRLIEIVDDKIGPYQAYPYPPTPIYERPSRIEAMVLCPVDLHAYDSQGRHTGVNISGDYEYNIPNSFQFGGYTVAVNETINETTPELIFLYNTTEDYWFEIVANLTEEEKNSPEIESFNFTVEQERGDMRTTIFYRNVPLTENTIAILPINLTTTAYTMEIDYDGDGVTDETREPDFIEINYAPTAAIVLPETGSIYNESEPIEFNGTGRDPEDGILTNFSLVWYSNMNGVIGAGETFSTANLSKGMHKITLMINDSVDLVDTESVMITVVDRTPPSTIINLQSTSANTGINWTWTNPPDPDFNHTELYLNGTLLTNIPAPQNYYNITGLLPDTSYELSTHTVDTSGNINETWVNDTAHTLPIPDNTPPTITFISSTDPSGTILTTRNWTFINVSLSEPGFSWLEWNGINETMSGSGTHLYINKTGLDNGVYTYCVWANDSAGNVNVSETRAIEI